MKKLLLMLVLVSGGLSAMNTEGGGGKGFEPQNPVRFAVAMTFAVLATPPVAVGKVVWSATSPVRTSFYASVSTLDRLCNAMGVHYNGIGDSCWGEE